MRLHADDPEWMQWVTILGMLACFGMLAFRWQVESRLNQGGNELKRVHFKNGLRLGKILWQALLAMLFIGLALRQLNHSLNLNRHTAYEPSPSDKAVMVLSGER